MKKIILSLFLIATSMTISRLSAYCIYNHSKDETISIFIYPSKAKSNIAPLFHKKSSYVLKPNGSPGCWNWKEIGGSRNKQWYFKAYKGGKKLRTIWTDKLGKGYFPIGSAVVFTGYDGSGRAIFNIHFGPDSESMPVWKTYKF